MEATTIESMMKHFHTELGSEKLKLLMSHFSGDKTIEEMFTILWDSEDSHKHLNPVLLPSRKSEEEALRMQGVGDEYFEKKLFTEALEQYNLSIKHSPHPHFPQKSCSNRILVSETNSVTTENYSLLSSGFAKRSAALFELGHIEQCLRDICLALSYGYLDIHGELEDRKAECVVLQKNDLNKDSKFLEDFKLSLKVTPTAKVAKDFPRISDPHPEMSPLCSGLRIAYSPEKGKHVIAERDFYPGEILGVERSSCSSLDFDNLHSHCSTCMMKSLAPLPCPDCAMVGFCSDACRAEALSGDHWLECRLLPTMQAMEMQTNFGLTFKLLQRYSCEDLRTNLDNLQNETKDCPYGIKDLSKDKSSRFRSIRSINHLVTNKDLRPGGDLYVKCLIALLLNKLLQQCGRYFVNSCGEPVAPTREDLLFTGQKLFSHLLKASCNGFKLVEIQCPGHYREMKKKFIGSALFPILCLFNHSCHPNTEPYSYGCIQVVRVSRLIPAGSEVTENYTRGFYLQPALFRQRYLQNVFQFNCTCEACEANWPTYQELPGTLQFKCLDCSQSVSDSAPMCMRCFLDYERKDYEPSKQLLVDEWCSTASEVRSAFLKSQRIAAKMMSGESTNEEDLPAICQAIVLMDKHVPFPCHPVWDAHDAFDLYFHREREKKFSNIQLPK